MKLRCPFCGLFAKEQMKEQQNQSDNTTWIVFECSKHGLMELVRGAEMERFAEEQKLGALCDNCKVVISEYQRKKGKGLCKPCVMAIQ